MSPVDSIDGKELRGRPEQKSVESRMSLNDVGSGGARSRRRGDEMRRRYMRKHVSNDDNTRDLALLALEKVPSRLPLHTRNDIYFPNSMDKQLMPIQDIRRQNDYQRARPEASRDLLQLRPSNLQFFHKSLNEFGIVEK